MLTARDRLIRTIGDDKFVILDGNGAVKREGVKGKRMATDIAISGAMGSGRTFWLNDDGTVEPL